MRTEKQTIRNRINEIKVELSLIYEELDKIEKLESRIEEKNHNIELLRLWKSRRNKYFAVKGFRTDGIYEYIFVKDVSQNKVNYFYGDVENKFKTWSNHDFLIEDFCEKWTEITKDEFENKIKDFEELQ